jgi:hypothetical protein
MIILDTVNRKLQVILSGAITTSQLPWTAHYVDVTVATGALSAVSSANGTTNSAVAVDMVAVPGVGVSRQIKALMITNEDTAAAVVTIRYNDGGTTRTLFKATLAVGDNLVYGD